MSVKLKLLLFFLSAYVVSMLSITLFTLATVSELLLNYTYDYMEYQIKPAVEFYKNLHANPARYIDLLASDVVSREMASIVIDKEGKVKHKEPFLDGEDPQITPEDIRFFLQNRKGILKEYTFIVKNIGDYKLVLLGKMEKIEGIQRTLVIFITLFTSFISLLIALVLMIFIRRMLRPLGYLTSISREVYRGNMNVHVEKSSSKDEFGVLQNAYRDMLIKLQKTFDWQRDFIAAMAHELKTPLTYVKGQLDLISIGVYSDETKLKEVIKKMSTQVGKMERLINHLVLLMRLESGMPLRLSPVSLNEIFVEIDEEYEFIKQTHNFRVEYLVEDVKVHANKDYLKIALGNLIENSYKYTPEGGTVKLYYANGCIVVEDSGRGIKDTQKVFERFYREAQDKEGFGLGLTIVKAIADAHHFDVHIDSRVGYGTKVSLCTKSGYIY
ncbi:putative sensor histidine kinase TcrY [bacterium HR13]|nr:putative sensor histidine kinase TcrY [bacterium HR13]